MKILVIGARKGIGAQVVEQGLEQGFEITAMSRGLQSGGEQPGLKQIAGDVLNVTDVETAVQGQNGVCFTIGVLPTFKPVQAFSRGTQIVLEAMTKFDVPKLVMVTGIGAGDSKGHGGFFYDKIFQPLLLKTIYEDKDRSEELVRQSDREWVIVRPGFLTNGPKTRRYRAITDLQGVTAGKISRADVADFILNQFKDMSFKGQTPLLTY